MNIGQTDEFCSKDEGGHQTEHGSSGWMNGRAEPLGTAPSIAGSRSPRRSGGGRIVEPLPITNPSRGRTSRTIPSGRPAGSSMIPYMWRVPHRPMFQYRTQVPWILAICLTDPISGPARSQPLNPRGLAANAAESCQPLLAAPPQPTASAPGELGGVHPLGLTKGTTGQTSRAALDISRLLATRTSRIRGGPGKPPIFSSIDKRGNA